MQETLNLSFLPSWQHVGMEDESIQRTLNNLGFDYVDLVSSSARRASCAGTEAISLTVAHALATSLCEY